MICSKPPPALVPVLYFREGCWYHLDLQGCNMFQSLRAVLVLAFFFSGFQSLAISGGCIESGDINDDRLRYWNCRLAEDNVTLKFDVEGYIETFLSDGRSNRATLSILSVGDTWVRIYVGNTVRAQAYHSTPENDGYVQRYCESGDATDSLLDWDTYIDADQDCDSTGSLIGDLTGFKKFTWTKADGSKLKLKCNKKWF
jgi:hypothetical protein